MTMTREERIEELKKKHGINEESLKNYREGSDFLHKATSEFHLWLMTTLIKGTIHHSVPPPVIMAAVASTVDELILELKKERPKDFEEFELIRAAITNASQGNVSNVDMLLNQLREKDRG